MNTIDFEFSKNIFNDSGNSDINFDVSDYNHNLNIDLKELTLILLLHVLDDFVNEPLQRENNDDVHLNKKQRKM